MLVAACGGGSSSSSTTGTTEASETPSSTSSGAPLSAALPADLRSSGTIKIATSVGYPPYEFYAEDGTTVLGYEPELWEIWGGALGLEPEWSSASFTSLFTGLESGRYNIILSGVVDNEEREQKYLMVDYAKDGWTVVYPQNNPKSVTSAKSLCGLSAAAVGGTAEENMETVSKECEGEGKPPIKVSVFEADTQGLLALDSGRVDVVSVQTASGAYYVSQNPEKYAILDSVNLNPGLVGIVVPKEQPELAAALKEAIQQSIDDGSYDKVMRKWGLESLEVPKAAINGGA
jgi:polar amino acid transport system substrate-binding protein